MRRYNSFLLKLCACIFTSLGLSNFLSAQNTHNLSLDSLDQELKQTKSDTGLLKIYHRLYSFTDSLTYAKKELALADSIKNQRWIAQASLDIGRYYYFYTDKQDSTLEYLKKSIQIAEGNNYQLILANAYRYMGFEFRATDSYMAQAYYEKSLVICEKLHNDLLASYDYSALGNIFESMRTNLSNRTALEYYEKSLQIREKLGSYEEKASSLLETSRVYELLGDFYKAFALRQQGLKLAEEAGDITNTVSLAHVIGCDYTDLFHDYKKSLEYQLQAYNLGRQQRNNFEILAEITRAAAKTYSLMGDYKKASDYSTLSLVYIDSMNTKRNNEVYGLSAAKHQLENELNKQRSKATIAEISKQKAETDRQTIQRNALLAGFALLLIIAAILYSGYRRKNITNMRLALTNRKLEEAHHDITDSINYASTIQKTILASKERIEEKLNEIFIVNLPKDIVSGDFYYHAEVGDKVILAACDCTGHGVPGAIVSIFCSNALHRAVKRFNILETGKILDKARALVLETFANAGSEVKDGMDISLCCIDPKTRTIQWSGANNPLLYVHESEMHELAPDKQPVGKQDGSKPFTTHTLQLDKGDTVYLFSDGYADQFGGPKGKKFTKKQFRDLLYANHNKSMTEQGSLLFKAHESWKGITPQVDDILVIGIRI